MKTTAHQQNPAIETLIQGRKRLLAAIDRSTATDLIHRHSRLFDDYFRTCFAEHTVVPSLAKRHDPYAIVALGGYGREEQNIHSDVDLLLLFKTRIPANADGLVRECIYPLWDMGLDVGYAMRTLEDAVTMALSTMDQITPLLDARFVCGMETLFFELKSQLHRSVLKKRQKQVLAWLVETNARRHRRFGDSTYRLEPNLKDGQGGLRDYHTMLWIGKIKWGVRRVRDLEYLGLLSHEEYAWLREALNFIWYVRNHLHRFCGRKCDQLFFENQVKVARCLQFAAQNGLKPVERFLGRLHETMDFIKQQYLMFIHEYGRTDRRRTRRLPPSRFQEIIIKRDTLIFDDSKSILQRPELLMHIFEESARLKIPLSAEAKRIVREFAYLVQTPFIGSFSVKSAFERILKEPAPTFNVLREMLNTGFLVRLIPEFKQIVNRIQYNAYHLYPVDKHVLRTLQALKALGTEYSPVACPLCNGLWKNLKYRRPLLWSALLHDIGKGSPSEDHAVTGARISRSVMQRFGYPNGDIDTVEFLVREHLLLVKTATRRDIHEEETAIFCARRIKTRQRLDMLYLLSIADSVSTGPTAWNDWTAALLRDLFLKVTNVMQHGELVSRRAVDAMEQKKRAVLDACRSQTQKEHVRNMLPMLSPRYLVYSAPRQITADLALYDTLGDKPFAWSISKGRRTATRSVNICARDAPGLFSKIAGTLTLNQLNILSAQIFTWRNHIALDIFDVRPPPDTIFETEKWEAAGRDLSAVLKGELDLSAALKNKMTVYTRINPKASKKLQEVIVDNRTSSFFTIIEVFAYDFPGLLYCITNALFEAGLDIWVAKISTKIDQVVDVFYVRDVDGQKVDGEAQVAAIRAGILNRLPEVV